MISGSRLTRREPAAAGATRVLPGSRGHRPNTAAGSSISHRLSTRQELPQARRGLQELQQPRRGLRARLARTLDGQDARRAPGAVPVERHRAVRAPHDGAPAPEPVPAAAAAGEAVSPRPAVVLSTQLLVDIHGTLPHFFRLPGRCTAPRRYSARHFASRSRASSNAFCRRSSRARCFLARFTYTTLLPRAGPSDSAPPSTREGETQSWGRHGPTSYRTSSGMGTCV